MPTADIVFTGGAVLGADGTPGDATAVAVVGDRIAAVGSPDDLRDFVAARTEVVDLAGKLLVPGFQDAHMHPVGGGLELISCNLSGTSDLAEYQRRIRAAADALPDGAWVTGGGWSLETFPGGMPTRQQIDAVVADRPVFLFNRDHHGAWANTRALELAGLTRDTPDPADGRIEREADGTPNGMLQEGAVGLVGNLVPDPTSDDLLKALLTAQEQLHALGITAWQDAILGEYNGMADPSDVYALAVGRGLLTARVRGALWWDRDRGTEQIPELLDRRARLALGDRFRADTVKVMQDGIAENQTAAMTEPYKDKCGCATANAGLSFVDPQALRTYVTELDAAGFQVHFHALGDRAVRESLDAVAAARAANGPRDNRHHLAHLQVVHPDDVPRFAALGATANMQPLWAAHEPQLDTLTTPFLGGELAGWQYPFGDLKRAGAVLAAGSDWPVSSPDPLAGIHVAVNRVQPGEDAPVFLPAQRIDLAAAMHAYTAGSAYVNHLDDTGVIRPGALADLAVLDRNPYAGPADEIAATRVARTYVGGRLVHAAE
ncbi:amidohydrolase [Yinghuangia aomiensis]